MFRRWLPIAGLVVAVGLTGLALLAGGYAAASVFLSGGS